MTREAEGWGGYPLKTHIENAQMAGDYALERVEEVNEEHKEFRENTCDRVASLEAETAELRGICSAFEKRFSLLETQSEGAPNE